MLLILNDPPDGTERSYHALRLAGSVCATDDRINPYPGGTS
jgi:hypothetical protein